MTLRIRFLAAFVLLAGIGPAAAIVLLQLVSPGSERMWLGVAGTVVATFPVGFLVAAWLFRNVGSYEDVSRYQRAREALQAEIAVACRIQTSMLPRALQARGLEVAARMVPALEVGGDYYDVLPTEDGAWIAIGDVAGHGLPAGIISLTVQSAVSALTHDRPAATPKEILTRLNQVIYENIKHRLQIHDYVTLSLLRFFHDGRMVVAGAHEDIIVFRAAQGRCESWPTGGTWIGVIDDIEAVTSDVDHRLEDGDVVVLFTDGVTEAIDADGHPFGFERLCATVAEVGRAPTERIVEHIVASVTAWSPALSDDISVMALRYRRPPGG